MDSKSTPNWTAYFLGKTDLFVQIDRPEPLGGSQIISKRNLNLKTRQKKRAVGALKARKKKLRVRAEIFLSCFPLEKAVFFPVTLLSGMRANQLASSLQIGFFGVEVKALSVLIPSAVSGASPLHFSYILHRLSALLPSHVESVFLRAPNHLN